MAKKYRVKYAFGTPEIYDALKRTGKLDEHTVYFISDENSEYGTFYRGAIKVGTSKASDLVFDKKVTVTLAKASDPNDDDLTIEIEAGTTLVAAINDIYKYIFEEADGLQERLNTLTGNGEVQGSINDAIANAFLDRFANGTLYTQAQCDEKFLTHAALGKIEDLIKVFTNPDTGEIDEEVINTIVDAAQGIQEVVSNYYTKQEMNEILVSEDKNIIKTYDSSANFPAAESASKNVFYVDDEENIVYRWGLNEEGTAREYVEISGAGSGSGGDVKLETKIYVKGGKTTVSVAKGNNLVVDFVFSSAYTMIRYNKATKEFEKIQQQTGSTASVKYYLDGIQFDSGYISQSNYNETDDTKNTYNRLIVPASRLNATKHTLKITAEDVAGNSSDELISVNIVSANITSSYVPTPISLDRELEIPVTVTSTSDAQLFYTIDGGDTIKVQDVPVGSPVIKITISPMLDNGVRRSHGYHNVKIWATTYIEESDTTISTRVLSYNVIWYDTENPLPIITTSLDIEENAEYKYDITQYNYATLTYQVYPASTVDLILKDVTTGIERIVNTLNVDTITKTWAYTFDSVGEYEMYINVHYGQDGTDILTSTKYDIVVSKSDISMDATPGSSVYFTAKNRSNSEANPAQWHSEIGNFDATLTGFLWNASSGWSNNGATTSLKVAGGARCVIPYKPFDRDKRTRGQVIEFDFSTSNLSDATATVISCYSESDNSGIEITATGAYFSSAEFGQTTDGDARIYVPFKENERIRLSFVITPMEEDEEGHGVNDDEAVISLWNGSSYSEVNTIREGWWKFVKVYLNGICVGIHNYSGSFQQSTPASIVIGSDSATVDIYSIRAYETVLYDRAIVNNFIADTQDPVEKLRLFKRNNILNEAGTDVEPSALRRLMPCLFVTCETDATVSGIINNEHILPTNKADKRGVTVFFDCDGLDDDAKKYYNFCHTFVAFNVQWAVQGTSSQYYPRRNWKGTFKTEKKFKEDYIATATSKKPTYIFVDAPWEESIKDGRDARAVYANKYKEQYNKNYQLKDFSAISDNDRTLDEISTIPAKKFCMKADFAESSGTHNTGFAKYVDFILKSMGYDYLTPPQKAQYNKTKNMADVSFRTSVDGYPIAMFWRPTFEDDWEFYGKFNFNIDKGAESVFGFIDTKDGGLSSSDVNPMTGQSFVEFNEDYYDAASQEDRIAYEPPIECWEFTNNSTDLCKFRNVTPTSFTETSTDADGVTEVPAWLGSFEVRHPDNDNLIDLDYGTGLKKPTHWATFSEWVSSTDRTGVHNYDKNLPIPTTWTGTYEELISGASDKEIFATYEGRLTEMIADHETEFDYNRRYILQPVVVDPGDGTISPDISYDLYGHIVHWNSVDSQWYDSSKELDTWVDDGPYVEEESNVDYTKAYWISDSAETNYKKVYKYNTDTNTWDNIANIDQYALESPVTYNTITYQYDTAEYRFAKFRVELPLHMSIPMTTAYYVLTEFFCCADQRAKNMMFASWGYEPGADKVKPAEEYTSEEEADAAGYKPVYSYSINVLDSSEGTTGTVKTVLYWVPKDAEYIWYPIFYDNDTILSLDNTGHIKFNPNVESTDRVGTGYAYNGTESVLWLNFKDAYDAEIRATYVTMRSKGGLTYANCMKYFNQSQADQWPENVYNIDGKFKYVIPATKGYVDYSTQDPNTGKYGVTIRNSSYLYECQGSREEHRKWWLNNRFTYMDSRYFAVAYAEDYATLRLYTPSIWEGVTPSSTFKLTPYADMYLRVMFGQIVSTVRAEKNKTYDIIPSDPDLRFNDTETIIYGASNILSFGDMTNKYAGSVAIDKASKITDIILGTSSPYYNENIVGKGLTIGAGNTTLKNIDVEGCTKLTEIVGLNQVNSIEKVDARRTGITTFNFSTTGANLNEIYYPNTIAEIKFVNMKNITYGNINIPNYSNLRSVWIENCPQLKTTSWNIINNILNTTGNVLSAARLVGFEWSITTPEAFATWSKLLTKKGYNASGIQEYDIPYLDGTVNIGGTVVVSTGYKSSIEAMFAEVGGLKVNVPEGNTVGLNGIKITPEQDILDFEGTAMIVPNKPYKFKASYLPDDFVLESEKGVTWNVPSQLTVIEQTSEYVILQYVGSTSGNNTYTMIATSKSDPSYVATISIRPSATLSRIKVTDTLGQEIGEDPIVIKEGETILLNVDFLPEGTDDTQITISAINGQHLTYTYDSMNKILTITGKEVDREQNCSLRLQSVTVPSVTRIIYLTVHNVVSRIFKLKNAAGDLIGGYINVDYIDAFTGEHITFGMPGSKFNSVTGVIQLRTDSSCGFGELKVEAHSNAAENGEKQYNQPATIVVPELATTATNDYEREFVFHDPITATITIKNAGAPVADRVLRIDSLENESIRNLITPPYNRVLAGQEVGGEAVEVKLLANTEHHITITELDEHGNMIVSGGRYSQYSGIIKTGTADASYTITISRDYLGNIDDENELHMTILTGAAGSAYNTVRIYVRTADTITIDWGDKEDYGSSQDATQWTTVIDGTQYAFDKEIPVYHIYRVREKEYDITVSANTQRIRWFHVIPESATQMLPCIGTTSSTEGFHTNWQASDTGGLVAYQSIGAAKFETLPTFRFANKTYSKLLSVGNVFKSCTTARTAESLFENSTVEQLYNGALFDNCTEIESFKNTFKNSNITILPSGFFMNNTKAKNFESAFENCTNLSSINSAENITFIRQDADVEVVSVLRMFAGCVNLTSEVPALWKTFYGCSFTSTPQKSFENCNKVVNFDNIPNDWGGQPNVSYIESEYKALRYFSTMNVPKSDTAEFITNIYPKGHYRYEYDIEFTADWYEMIPLFGAAIGTTDGINTTLESVIDFNRGGNAEGTSPGIYTAYMPYRINAAPDADWALALNLSTGNAGEVFGSSGGGTGYGNMGEHIIFDISYTTDGRVTVYPYGTNKENTQKQFRIADWDNGINWRATLPLKILNIYNTHELPYDAPSGESTTELYRGKYIKFYSLKIYDDSEYKSLIHEIVPVYGQVPNTNVMTAFLYDKMTDTPFVCSTPDTSKLSYYAKND